MRGSERRSLTMLCGRACRWKSRDGGARTQIWGEGFPGRVFLGTGSRGRWRPLAGRGGGGGGGRGGAGGRGRRSRPEAAARGSFLMGGAADSKIGWALRCLRRARAWRANGKAQAHFLWAVEMTGSRDGGGGGGG